MELCKIKSSLSNNLSTALTTQRAKAQCCPVVLQENTAINNDTHKEEGKLCYLLLVSPREGGTNHNPGKPLMVLFPKAEAAATSTHSSSAGHSKDGGICNGMGEEVREQYCALPHHVCLSSPDPSVLHEAPSNILLHDGSPLSPSHCYFDTTATVCL